MLTNYLMAMALIMLLMLAWVTIQQFARLFAKRHPHLGPAREEGGGCGGSCLCSGGHSCKKER